MKIKAKKVAKKKPPKAVELPNKIDPGNKARFNQLLDDAVLGIKNKK